MVSIADCGLMLEPQQAMSIKDIVDWATIAEQKNYGYILRSDHLLPIWDSKDRDSPECWSSLGVLAATTKKIKFGPLVSPIGFRNPALLARMACNLNDYSYPFKKYIARNNRSLENADRDERNSADLQEPEERLIAD